MTAVELDADERELIVEGLEAVAVAARYAGGLQIAGPARDEQHEKARRADKLIRRLEADA